MKTIPTHRLWTLFFVALVALFSTVSWPADARLLSDLQTVSWSDFQPQSWLSSAGATSSIKVSSDQSVSPLNAQFRVSDNAGSTWSLWMNVALIEDLLSHQYRLTTPIIQFNEGRSNRVQFRWKTGENTYQESPVDENMGTVLVDLTAPTVWVTSPLYASPQGFNVTWSMEDPQSGSPATNVYDVYYSLNSTPGLILWLEGLANGDTERVFGRNATPVALQVADTVYFEVSARNQAGLEGRSERKMTSIKRFLHLPLMAYNHTPTPTVIPTPSPTASPTPTPLPLWAIYEPNDRLSTAHGPLDSQRSYDAFIWPPGDQDYYFVDVSSLSVDLIINLTNIPPGTDYDLYLYNSLTATQPVASSSQYGNTNEAIRYRPSAKGRYYIRIYPYQGTADQNQPYRLTATFQ